MPTLKEKQIELDTKRQELAAQFAKHRDKDGNWTDVTPAVQTEFIQRNDELKSLADAVTALEVAEKSHQENEAALKSARDPQRGFAFTGGQSANGSETQPVKTLGELFVESAQYQNRRQFGRSPFAVEVAGGNSGQVTATKALQATALKALLTTSAGFAPYPARQAEIVPYPVRQPVVAALIPITETTAASIIYLEVTTWTNNAAAVAEGTNKPESALVATQRTVPMTKIATTLPVTEEQLDYIPGIRQFIDNTLGSQIYLEEDRELLLGNGTPEFTGFLNKAGINTQPKGADDVFTAALKLLTKIRTVGFANPDGWVLNPTDWQTFATQKDAQGRFILGDPGQQTEMRLWGLPVVDTVAETQGTLLAGAFRTWSHLWRNMELRIDVGYVNAQFLANEMTIRAEMREALQITRPSAFGVATGF